MTAIHHHKTDLTHTVTRKWSYNRKNVSHCTPVNNHLLNINIKMKITGNYTIVNCLFLESEEDSGCANNSFCDIQRKNTHKYRSQKTSNSEHTEVLLHIYFFKVVFTAADVGSVSFVNKIATQCHQQKNTSVSFCVYLNRAVNKIIRKQIRLLFSHCLNIEKSSGTILACTPLSKKDASFLKVM